MPTGRRSAAERVSSFSSSASNFLSSFAERSLPVARSRSHHLGQRDAEARGRLVHHHHLAAGDDAPIDDHVDRLADTAVERDDGAAPELDEARNRHGGRAENDLHGHRYAHDHLEVG
jgi:hypothetical protein